MPISSVLSSAISGLAQSADRAGKAAEKVVTAAVPNQGNSQSTLDVRDSVTLSDPALARTEGLMEIT